MARYDFNLSEEEFWDMTPTMFQALCKRRNVNIRYDRYANALTASAVYNTARTSEDMPVISAFDFIRDESEAIKIERTREVKKYIKQVIGQMPMSTSRTRYLEVRSKVINDLTRTGNENAEALFDSVWPSLKPTEDEV